MNILKAVGSFGSLTLLSRVLGYFRDILIAIFIGTSSMADASPRDTNQFKTMYGKDSQFVDTNKIAEIARTMNSKFLETV